MIKTCSAVVVLGLLGAWSGCSSSGDGGDTSNSPEGGANAAGAGNSSAAGNQQAGGKTALGGSATGAAGLDTASGGTGESSAGAPAAGGETNAGGNATDGGNPTSSGGGGSSPAGKCSGHAPVTSCVTSFGSYSTCNETTGVDFEQQATKDQLKNNCETARGTFGSGCPTTKLYGRCIASCGKSFEQITYYYDSELGVAGKQTCTNTQDSVWDGP